MKKIFTSMVLLAGLMAGNTGSAQISARRAHQNLDANTVPWGSAAQAKDNNGNLWRRVPEGQAPSSSVQVMHPKSYLVYSLTEAPLKIQLFNLSTAYADAAVISLPMPDGSFRSFKVWQTPLLPDDMTAQFPDIKNFTGEAVNDPRVTAKIDFTVYGFHAMIFDNNNVSFIDPFDNYHDGYYMVHYKKDEQRSFASRMKCEVKDDGVASPSGKSLLDMHDPLPKLSLKKSTFDAIPPGAAAATVNGTTIRSYAIAIAADHFYCQSATGLPSPTITQCLSKITVTLSRVDGVYNREFSVHLAFAPGENNIIWESATGSVNGADPFNAIDANPSACLTQNQTSCDAIIGSANYDIGHVFTTNGGGLASLGIVCNNSFKAQGVTGSSTPVGDGYDIDYVAHEVGHEFGSSHTFGNNLDGSCGGNMSASHAYEPGSGATIMDYAGICSPDDLQPHSDPYFSGSSVMQITALLAGAENACATVTTAPHVPATMSAFIPVYNIPYKTPFELTRPAATVSAGDTATTYGWFQWNLGSTGGSFPESGKRLNQTFVTGPIFRSYQPAYTPDRVFPKIDSVLKGVLTFVNTENAEGEKAPDTARYLTFKMAVRNIQAGNGAIIIPDDSVHINVSATGAANGYAGFKVTSQGTTGISYTGGSTQTVAWNVVGTNAAPVSAATVDIYMSTDGGYTWPYTVGNFPNNGSASVTVPNPAAATTTARFKVKGSGNVFFNVNGKNFTVNPVAATSPITGTFTVCPGGTTTLADATTGGTWVSGTTAVATVGSASGIVTGITAGTTIITYVVGSGNVTAIVTVNPVPAAGTITGSAAVCIGQTITLADAATGGVWSSTNTARATVDASGVVTGISAGAATISYTVTNSCGTVAATKAITVNTATVVAPVTGTMVLCTGATTTLSDVTPSGVWSSGSTGVATVNASGVVTGVTAGTAGISYSVTNGSGCVSSSVATVTVNAVPGTTISPSGSVTICAGGSVTLSGVTGTGYTYQWQAGGGAITGASSATYVATTAGNYNVVVTNGTCSTVSAIVIVSTGTGATVVPSVSISASPGLVFCTTPTPVTFTATPVNGGSTPVFQWFVNGVAAGSGGTTYSYTPAGGDVVSCQLTSSDACASPATVSASVTVSISAPATPSVSISASPNDTVCTGGLITLSALPVAGGTAPTYLWTVNGVNVATGSFYSYIPANGDVAVCTMTSNASCVSSATAVSAPLTLHVQVPVANVVSVSASSTSITEGATITFTAIAPNAGTAPVYRWYINGTPVAGANTSIYVTDSLQNGQIVTCSVTSSIICATPHTVISGGITILVSTGVYEPGSGLSNIVLAPNPNTCEFIIKGALGVNTDQQVSIGITNMLGQSVYKKDVLARNGILHERVALTNTLPAGMYLVNMTTGDDHIVFHMVISR